MDTLRSRPPPLPLLLALLGALLLPGPSPIRAAEPRTDTVLILHTNDLHSHLLPGPDGQGGMARIAGYVERVRASRDDVLLLDAGDAVTGTPASSIFGGRPAFAVMNAMGCDAMALGNHEFDHGFARIATFREIAAFPILSANATGPDGKLLADAAYAVLPADGVRVGVIGVTAEETPEITAGGATEGCTFAPAAARVKALLPEVEAKSDLVVVLSHLGLEADRALAAAVPGIDVIVGGHSHTAVEKPEVVGETIVVQAFHSGRRLGRLELVVDLDAGRVVSHEGSLVRVDGDLSESPNVRAAVEAWEEKVRERVDVKIGETRRGWKPDELRPLIERVFREAVGADAGFENAGGIRAGLAAGDVTIRDVWNVMPFENTIVTVRVKGAQLPAWARERLGAGTIDRERVYTIATNSFVAAHADRYFPKGTEGKVDSGLSTRQAVVDRIRRRGGP